ncbi:hypothetical protein MIMGU_mgv1a010727mg [Erythranthe guttata]|uniref:O-fucosyltransferase family protein n=1 Tax=Erythranthe guttata TaxID=4155 RepID=A0A022QT40_ERYGU|nr:hypothetical protein MIMGU_mgv1a010727mg [Erythranthe guttata]
MGFLPTRFKHSRFFGLNFSSPVCKCMFLLLVFVAALVFRSVFLPTFSDFVGIESLPHLNNGGGNPKFLEVPQIVWGLNNQKIAFARACLTARTLNRTLVMPSLSASLFYKEVDQLKPISFDKVFHFEKFNSLCKGFVQLGRSHPQNSDKIELIQKGSGRKWTVEKDLEQLQQLTEHPYNEYGTIRILGKNPFLWHDHWPVKDYAKVFECLVLVEEISNEADKVVSKIRKRITSLQNGSNSTLLLPYVAVHMRIEKDWMIHCKKLEQRLNVTEICSSKEQIIERVGNIAGLKTPIGIYLAVPMIF